MAATPRSLRRVLIVAAILGGAIALSRAEDGKKFPTGTFNGLVFGDYYHYARYHQDEVGGGNANPVEGQSGFWMRRIYLGYAVDFSETISGLFRIEANSNGRFEGGSLEPYVKDAYLGWRYSGAHRVVLGIQPTLTFDWLEKFWGLRHVEKTPADLYKIDASRDFGIAFSGPAGPAGLSYGVQWGNDSGQGSETDRYKIFRLEARFDRGSGLAADLVYGASDRPERADRDTWSGFLGYRADTWRLGANYLHQTRRAPDGADDPRDQEIDIGSLFAVWEFLPRKASVYGRLDDVKGHKGSETTGLPDADGIDYWLLSPAEPFRMIILGGEWYVLPDVRVGPNVEWATYDADPDPVNFPGRDDDLIYRITFFWSW